MKQRLDIELTTRGITTSRSQAESWVKLGKVTVDGRVVTKPGQFVRTDADIRLTAKEQYVSRAGLKLASVAKLLNIDFKGKTVLDVGSSTGGFTDYALQHGAAKVYAVDVGTEQLHPSLRSNDKIELHEKTNILDVRCSNFEYGNKARTHQNSKIEIPASDLVVIDVSFVSLRELLPHIATLVKQNGQILAMLKPQFEAGRDQVNKGVIKNDSVRRQILKDFELWSKQYFVIADKRDSEVAGSKGNQERFYLLKTTH